MLGPSRPLGGGLSGILATGWAGPPPRAVGPALELQDWEGARAQVESMGGVCSMGTAGQQSSGGSLRGPGAGGLQGSYREGQEPRRPAPFLARGVAGYISSCLWGQQAEMETVEGSQLPVTVPRLLGLDSPCLPSLTCCPWRVYVPEPLSWTPPLPRLCPQPGPRLPISKKSP